MTGRRATVLVATRNPGKLRELQPMFAAAGYTALDLGAAGVVHTAAEDTLEEFATFEENALAKARYFHAVSGGLPTVADDSGLVVDALDGAPGVRSRRWCGRTELTGHLLDQANNEKLVAMLAGQPSRAARFVCAAAFVDDGREVVRRGETAGVILDAPAGAEGFGYDPYFWSEDLQRSFGEAPAADKARVSHRARAIAALLLALRSDQPDHR
ncbi:MAG TPA: non-canonical purine NTP pyrophosphatase [Gemmatimonadaceae bacterium]|nr:non-canonical purine NTP pyrophosphatase [Gemmatimonadaceae bacterium]